jgi:hypothetical protein
VCVLPLKIRDGHMFVFVGGDLFLLDTGAPDSFGLFPSITIAGRRFPVGSSYLGLTIDILSNFVGVRTAGLLGADILGAFDIVIDAPGGSITFSAEEVACDGEAVSLDYFMGIPIVPVQIGLAAYRMFFDRP